MTSKERIIKILCFNNVDSIPIDFWTLPLDPEIQKKLNQIIRKYEELIGQ